MKFETVMHYIAQGVINIAEGQTTIERDSPIHQAMSELCRLVTQGEITAADLQRQRCG